MEHLHFAGADQIEPYPVSYLGHLASNHYDGRGWHTYPARVGYDLETLLTQHKGDVNAEFQRRSTLQEWLWFGVLHELCDTFDLAFERDDFIRVDGEEQWLSTASLPALAERIVRREVERVVRMDNTDFRDYVTAWMADGNHPTDADRVERTMLSLKAASLSSQETMTRNIRSKSPMSQKRYVRIHRCLTRASDFLQAVTARRLARGYDWYSSLFMATPILLESLARLCNCLFEPMVRMSISPQDGLLVWKVVAKRSGQCLHDANRDANSVTASQAYVGASLVYQGEDDHTNCAVNKCEAVATDPHENLPAHSGGCSGDCGKLVGLSADAADRIKELYDQDSYGVLRLQNNGSEEWHLDVLDASYEGLRYCAISHVWSHGLGNPHENSIFLCQLTLISQRLRACDPGISAFWLDTLCVPLERSHRRKAIAKMSTIYRRAARVLVLDNGMLKVGSNVVEQSFRLLLSEWMRRLWTLQEGILAEERLLFAFKSVFRTFDELRTSFWVGENAQRRVFYETVSGMISSFFLIPQDTTRLLTLATNMQNRATWKSEDEAICLATLMELGLSSLPLHPTLCDVFTALHAQGLLQTDILFLSGRRMNKEGFRWAPDSFLDRDRQPNFAPQVPARLDARGLWVFKSGIICSEDLYFDPFVGSPEHGNFEKRHYAIVDGHGRPFRYFTIDDLTTGWLIKNNSFDPSQHAPRLIKSPALIYQKSSDEFWLDTAILVSPIGAENGQSRWHYEARVMTATSAHFEQVLDDRGDASTFVRVCIPGVPVENREWCVD